MTENYDQETHQRNYTSNQLRSNHIRNKKSLATCDKEQLYAENLELRDRIKELIEINTKMKTQLSVTEKEKINLCHIAQQQLFHPKLGPRSQSSNQKKGALQHAHTHQNTPVFFNNPLLKQKQNAAMKKLMREQTIEIEKLNNENQRLKKTMKYTRMTEILTQNQELINETLRLKAIISEKKEMQQRLNTQFTYQIDALRKKLNHEKDSQKRNGYQLKKQIDAFNELKQKLTDIQSKKIQTQKRLTRQNKVLRNELNETKSKLYELTAIRTKDCNREDCFKALKERNQYKSKKQILENQIKKLKDQLEATRRNSRFKDNQINKMQTEMTRSKVSEKGHKVDTSNVKKVDTPKSKNNSIVFEKKQELKPTPKVVQKKQQPKVHPKKQQIKKGEPKKEEPKKEEPAMVDSQQPVFSQPHYIPPRKTEEISAVPVSNNRSSNINQSDSMDTQKLLASVENIENELKIQSTTKVQQNQKEKIADSKKEEKIEPVNEKMIESDGQYQELNYDDFQNQQESPKVKETKQQKKKQEPKKQTIDKNQENEKKKKEKKKQKSTKKIQTKHKPEQDTTHNPQKQQNDDKSELKLIKQTLYYKFMAQNYSYDNFCEDIKKSKMKEFTISDLINLMGSQPFLLADNQVETVLMYIFETDNPTGEEILTSKDFIRKMKKFIGKTKQINEDQQNENLSILSELIQNDVAKGEKLRKKFEKLADPEDQTITMQQFQQVMQSSKIKGSTLQTALAHIAVVSQDLHHLNYDMFLKRFTQQE